MPDTIREALTQASVTLDLYGKAVLSRECYDALAALTELEADRDRLADTLRDLATLERPADLMRQIARAALERKEVVDAQT